MTITAQDLLTTLGNRAWSGFNVDDMIFTSDDSLQARAELNAALRYLINLEDFPFRSKKKNIITVPGISQYSAPVGQITEIYDADSLGKLEYTKTKKELTATGTPTEFFITYNNPKTYINLYPVPDNQYNFTVVYNQFMPVLANDKTVKYQFTAADDYINMPASLEYLFADCLILRTMIQNNKDEQDENYRPTIQEFEECWRVFKRACNAAKTVPTVVWNQV